MKTTINTYVTTMLMVALSCSGLSQAENGKSTIAVVPFVNRTKVESTRVAPGSYKEKNIKAGVDNTSTQTSEVKGGKRIDIQTEKKRDYRVKEIERVIEYAPGAWRLPDTAGEIVADTVCSDLVKSQMFTVLDRSTFGLKTVEAEKLYMSFSGVGNAGIIETLREKGAEWMIVGAIDNYRVDEVKGSAYGMNVRKVITKVSLNIRVIDVATGGMVFSETTKGGSSMRIPESVSEITTIYDWEQSLQVAVSDATGKLITHLKKLDSSGGEKVSQMVSLNIESDPAGADIKIDGVFVGNTPTQLNIKGEVCEISLELQGHKPWKNKMMPRSGMLVKPVLQSINPIKPPRQRASE